MGETQDARDHASFSPSSEAPGANIQVLQPDNDIDVESDAEEQGNIHLEECGDTDIYEPPTLDDASQGDEDKAASTMEVDDDHSSGTMGVCV